jgi:hypothetical protein
MILSSYMKESETTSASCGNCGYSFKDGEAVAGQKENERDPCPICGSKGRAFGKQLSSQLTTHSSMEYQVDDPSQKKLAVEGRVGDNQYHDTGEWNKLERQINRRDNKYYEKIIDGKTGKVIIEQDEPLDKHTRHGSDKKKK